MSISYTTENREVSSANSLALDDNPSGKSLMQIKKSNEPKVDPRGTPALTLVYEEDWPLSVTFCFPFRKPDKMFSMSSKIQFC